MMTNRTPLLWPALALILSAPCKPPQAQAQVVRGRIGAGPSSLLAPQINPQTRALPWMTSRPWATLPELTRGGLLIQQPQQNPAPGSSLGPEIRTVAELPLSPDAPAPTELGRMGEDIKEALGAIGEDPSPASSYSLGLRLEEILSRAKFAAPSPATNAPIPLARFTITIANPRSAGKVYRALFSMGAFIRKAEGKDGRLYRLSVTVLEAEREDLLEALYKLPGVGVIEEKNSLPAQGPIALFMKQTPAPSANVHPEMLKRLAGGGLKRESLIADIKELALDPAEATEAKLSAKGFKREEARPNSRRYSLGAAHLFGLGQRVVFDVDKITLVSFAGSFIQIIVMDRQGTVLSNSTTRLDR